MSSPGVFCYECSTFLDMMNDIGIDKKQQLYIIKKMINIAIKATYYIFCCRNRNWDSPDFMQFWCLFFFFCFCFVLFCFDFWIIQSQAAFVNRLYVARFTIVHSKTQKVSIIIIILFVSFCCCSFMEKMKTGRVSGPFETNFNIHLICQNPIRYNMKKGNLRKVSNYSV